MKKKLLGLVLGLCMAVTSIAPITALADGQKVVTLGADLDENQRAAILKYFGVLGQNIKTLYITNQDERNHLGHYVPIEQIGTHTFSCALVNPTNTGGIQVKTANLNWVTGNMIATTLSTSGVVNCEVLAASPFEVSGTGALTGIIMAYETATGTQLDPVKKDLATQELITTGTIANNVGQNQATGIVNEIKIQIIEGQVVDEETVEEIVNEVVDERIGEMPDYEMSLLTQLAQQIADQQYNFDDMRDTLTRVEDNVSNISSDVSQIQQDIAQQTQDPAAEPAADPAAAPAAEPATEPVLPADSIMNDTDIDALGGEDNVVTSDTLTPAASETSVDAQPVDQPAPAPAEDFGFDIVSQDSYTDQPVDMPAEQPADMPVEQPADVPVEQPADVPVEQPADVPVEQPADVPAEQPAEQPQDAGAAALTLGEVKIAQNSDESFESYTGANIISVLVANNSIVPVSGSLTIAGTDGSVTASVDLANTDQVAVRAASADTLTEYGWSEGTEILVNIGSALEPNCEYTISFNGVLAQTSDPAAAASAPQAEASASGRLYTEGYGATLSIASVNDLQAGKTVSGSIIINPEVYQYAEVTWCDENVSIDPMQIDPAAGTGFTVYLNSQGTAEVNIDFYTYEGTADSFTFYIPVL